MADLQKMRMRLESHEIDLVTSINIPLAQYLALIECAEALESARDGGYLKDKVTGNEEGFEGHVDAALAKLKEAP